MNNNIKQIIIFINIYSLFDYQKKYYKFIIITKIFDMIIYFQIFKFNKIKINFEIK